MAVLAKENLPFELIECKRDNYGRFVFVKASTHGEEFNILNIY